MDNLCLSAQFCILLVSIVQFYSGASPNLFDRAIFSTSIIIICRINECNTGSNLQGLILIYCVRSSNGKTVKVLTHLIIQLPPLEEQVNILLLYPI